MPGRRGVSPVRRSRSDPGDRHVVAGGGYARKRLTGLTPGASITVTVTVTIGAGGTAGTTGGAAPTNGAASSFAGSGFTTVSATGGVINPLNSPTSPGLGMAPTRIEEPNGGTVIHCLSRISDEVEQGIGPDDLPILGAFETKRNSLSLLIGDRARLCLNVIPARDFDEIFGYSRPRDIEPSVYAGWRLP